MGAEIRLRATRKGQHMFDTERFVDSCRAALAETAAETAMKELMLRTMERPGDVEAALKTPTEGGI